MPDQSPTVKLQSVICFAISHIKDMNRPMTLLCRMMQADLSDEHLTAI